MIILSWKYFIVQNAVSYFAASSVMRMKCLITLINKDNLSSSFGSEKIAKFWHWCDITHICINCYNAFLQVYILKVIISWHVHYRNQVYQSLKLLRLCHIHKDITLWYFTSFIANNITGYLTRIHPSKVPRHLAPKSPEPILLWKQLLPLYFPIRFLDPHQTICCTI